MDDQAQQPEPALPASEHDESESRSLLARLLLWTGFGLASLALLAAAVIAVLDTGPGRRFISDQLEQITFRSEEHTSELQSLMRISYAVFCLKKKNKQNA